MRLRSPWMIRSSVAAACAAFCVWSYVAADQRKPASTPGAEIIRYEAPGGETYFALKLRADHIAGATVARDHVVIVDTSASQAGAHRKQALGVLESMLNSLPENDRVSLLAVDVSVTPMTTGFVAPRSAEIRKSVSTLKKRVPLGSSQLFPALEAALQSFGEGRARSITYIGDGMSTGQLIATADMKKLLASFRSGHISVHSYGVGPRVDLQVLGALAEQTGGVVIVDNIANDKTQSARQLGVKLAQAIAAPVMFPESIQVEPVVDQLLPTAVPPIRMDRDTVLLGRGSVPTSLRVTVKNPRETLTWTASRRADQPGNTFLASLWNASEKDEGACLPLAGNQLFNAAREDFETQVALLVSQGRDAVIQRNPRQAESIAWSIRQADPANVQARIILQAAQQVRQGRRGDVVLAQNDAAPPDASPPPPVDKKLDDTPDASAKPAGTPVPTKSIDQEIDNRAIRAQLLKNEVNRSIEAAQKVMNENPEAAITELQRVLSTLKSEAGIDATIQESLRTRIISTMNLVKNRQKLIETNKVQFAEQLAATEARRQAIDRLTEREDKMTQLIDKVRALLYEGFLGNENAFEEAESVARAAWELDPYNGSTVAAIFNAEAAGQLDKAMRLRSLRADKFLAVLYQVELSHVPFPDEPPILWPAPEVWDALTKRRKKWASMDLMKYRPTELKIREALEKPTTVNFVDTQLKDALMFLKDQHGINIFIDEAALQEESISTDTPVNLVLSDIQLRSVLKLMLEHNKLAYVIEDEVLKITTAQKEKEKLVTRVYPVGDLTIPISSGGMMGGGLGGMGGMMGGGMGGMGGGMGGMGGGMGGMGGMFDVPSEPASKPGIFNNDAVKQRKKKL